MEVDLAIKVKTQPLLVNFSDKLLARILEFVKSVSRKNEALVAQLSASTAQGIEEMQKKVRRLPLRRY